ncbi:hypothetical protein [Pseudorhodoferax sp. Leaf274]|uniref:hypothetical protein n=1 Tax=Pseudorhodoferax sp. Leaf274 TaxID=1736318 RepID=UPI000702FDE5|nr:hypothetical protein [Pseudorhodoferax sp. Leaf274]KQP35861.1 hypothetical protein ASF44_21430 [Pseudorhodoferax sp. Leaf274]
MSWFETFPPLTIEPLPNGNLRLEDPTERSDGYTTVLDLHPMQLRLMAERLGLLREVSASDAVLLQSEREHAQRQRAEIDSLKRRLLLIRDRALSLQDNFRRFADWENADPSNEMYQINGLVALLDLAVDDFECADPSAPKTRAGSSAVDQAPAPPAAAAAAPADAPPQACAPAAPTTQLTLLEGPTP